MILICSSINSPETSRLIARLNLYNYTKSLLIDVSGEILNNQKLCFRNFTAKNVESADIKGMHINTYVLTILTGKLKQYLNSTSNQSANAVLQSLNADRMFRAKRKSAIGETIFENSTVRTVTTIEFIKQWRTFYRSVCPTLNSCSPTSTESCRQRLVFTSDDYSKAKTKLLCEALLAQKILTKRSSVQSDDRLCPFVLFSLFDYVTAVIKSEMATADVMVEFEYVVMNMREDVFVWPPTLTLDTRMLNDQVKAFNNASPDFTDRLWISLKLFWTCGTRCWIIVALVVVVFLFATCGCIAVGIAVRLVDESIATI